MVADVATHGVLEQVVAEESPRLALLVVKRQRPQRSAAAAAPTRLSLLAPDTRGRTSASAFDAPQHQRRTKRRGIERRRSGLCRHPFCQTPRRETPDAARTQPSSALTRRARTLVAFALERKEPLKNTAVSATQPARRRATAVLGPRAPPAETQNQGLSTKRTKGGSARCYFSAKHSFRLAFSVNSSQTPSAAAAAQDGGIQTSRRNRLLGGGMLLSVHWKQRTRTPFALLFHRCFSCTT